MWEKIHIFMGSNVLFGNFFADQRKTDGRNFSVGSADGIL